MEDHFSQRDWPEYQFLKFRVLLLHDATCSKPFRCYKLLWYQSIVLALIEAALVDGGIGSTGLIKFVN